MLSVLITILSISLSFLAISTTLNLKDDVDPEVFGHELYFESISVANITGNAQELSKPFIDNKTNTIKNFSVSFDEYNDSIDYIINIVNGSKVDSVVSSITYTEPVCYSSGPNAIKDAEMVCDNIAFKVTYDSGEDVKIGDSLKSHSKDYLKITISYLGEYLPSNTVEIENLSVTIIYTQK